MAHCDLLSLVHTAACLNVLVEAELEQGLVALTCSLATAGFSSSVCGGRGQRSYNHSRRLDQATGLFITDRSSMATVGGPLHQSNCDQVLEDARFACVLDRGPKVLDRLCWSGWILPGAPQMSCRIVSGM